MDFFNDIDFCDAITCLFWSEVLNVWKFVKIEFKSKLQIKKTLYMSHKQTHNGVFLWNGTESAPE